MLEEMDIIIIVTTIIAIIISIIALIKSSKHEDSQSMLECFQIMNTPEIKKRKKITAQEYHRLLDEKKPIIFEGDKRIEIHFVQDAFEQISVLYQLGLINKKLFLKVYGETIVRFWKMMKEDILNDQKNNPTNCKHFQELAEYLIANKCDVNPY